MEGCPDEPCQATSSPTLLERLFGDYQSRGSTRQYQNDLCLQVQDTAIAMVPHVIAVALEEDLTT
jgi:hypothetical protein